MPIARGTIDKKRKNDCGFQLDDGNWYSRLDGPPIPELQEWKDNNVTIEVEWTQDGQWKNFKNNPTAVQQEESAADQSTGGKGGLARRRADRSRRIATTVSGTPTRTKIGRVRSTLVSPGRTR